LKIGEIFCLLALRNDCVSRFKIGQGKLAILDHSVRCLCIW